MGDAPRPAETPSSTDAPGATPVDDALNCPLCGYDLRGLPANRCPECGHAFDPDALRRAKLERQEWLFEHAKRPATGFARTTFASLRPLRFWTRVAAAHAIVPHRLKAWGRAWAVLFLVGTVGAFLSAVTADWRAINASAAGVAGGAAPTYAMYSYTPAAFAADLTWSGAVGRVANDRQLDLMFAPLAVVLAWPLVSYAALQVFGFTLKRAGIGGGHLARCVLYPLPTLLLPVIVYAVGCCWFGWLASSRWDWPEPLRSIVDDPMADMFLRVAAVLGLEAVSVVLIVVTIATSTLHFATAHARYLRLRHAIAQALLVQIVTWLALAAVLFGVSEAR